MSKTSSKEKKIDYQIFLTYNGIVKKVLYKSRNRNEIMDKYYEYLSISNKVSFKKETISSNGIKKLNSEIILVRSLPKKTEVPKHRIFNKKWKIIKQDNYYIEETFSMYGYSDKKTADEIIKILNSENTSHRELGIVNNKIVVYNGNHFDLIITKCPDDATRLAPYIYLNGGSYKNYFYHGHYKGYDKRDIISLICEETEWKRERVTRKFTDNRK